MSESQAQAEVRTVGFVFVSSVVHVLLVIGILALKAEQTPPKDVVEIQILGDSQIAAMPLAGTLPAVKSVSEAPKVALKSTAQKITKDDIVAPIAKAAPALAAQKMMNVQPTALPAEVNTPLETPELDEPKNISAAPQQQLNPEEFSKDLDQVDQDSDVKVAAVQKNLNSETDEALQEHENETQQLKEKTAAENAALTKQIEMTKAQAKAQELALAKAEAARQAQAQAQAEQSASAQVAAEQANADKAAADKAAKLAAEKAQADQVAAAQLAKEQAAEARASEERMLAAKAAANNAAMMAAQQKAAQQAKSGAGQNSGEVATNEVRSLNELRQVPGNEHPAYDPDDRLKGRQGDVAFLAYISKEGAPVKFKMVQSSGFRELDAKTLRAIRSWKFYPGQEGWVEIPFRWDLKGGPQEMPATLRRKISQF